MSTFCVGICIVAIRTFIHAFSSVIVQLRIRIYAIIINTLLTFCSGSCKIEEVKREEQNQAHANALVQVIQERVI